MEQIFPKITKKSLEQLISDDNLSEWFNVALKTALERDIFEAELDAELLYNALKSRRIEVERRILEGDSE